MGEGGKVGMEVVLRLVAVKLVEDVGKEERLGFGVNLTTGEEMSSGFIAGVRVRKSEVAEVGCVTFNTDVGGDLEEMDMEAVIMSAWQIKGSFWRSPSSTLL